jgi:hypothetical protein
MCRYFDVMRIFFLHTNRIWREKLRTKQGPRSFCLSYDSLRVRLAGKRAVLRAAPPRLFHHALDFKKTRRGRIPGPNHAAFAQMKWTKQHTRTIWPLLPTTTIWQSREIRFPELSGHANPPVRRSTKCTTDGFCGNIARWLILLGVTEKHRIITDKPDWYS